MSYTEAQLWDLMDQVDEMPYGPGHIALVERIIAHADAMHLTELGFAARMEGLRGYRQMGEPTKALVAFAWLVAEFDRDPTTHADHYSDLLWDFKFAVSALTRSPEIPLDRTYAVLDDMQRRWVETGHSLHAVHSHRHRVARHIGDFDTAARYYELWCAAVRDDLSDCAGCDPEMKAYWLSIIGRDEEAVALGANVLSGDWTCSQQPQSILTTLMVPYLRTGRLDEARDAHRRAYRLHRPNVADLAEIGEHIAFCARTGNEARALEIVERHIGWLDRSPSPWDTMIFAASSAHALRRAQAVQPAETLTVFRPGTDDREAGRLTAAELAAQLEAQAVEISGRFDDRNGTARVGIQVRAILDADPLIDHLQLSPAALSPATVSTVDPVDPSTVVSLFAKTTGGADGAPSTAVASAQTLDYDEAVGLVQGDRAGEAVPVLVEAVADRTARGDAAGAADARHALAIAYLNSGRPFEAAEVAEEELAYRSRIQTGPDEPSPAIPARRLLAAVYLELQQPEEAMAQLDAVAADCVRLGNEAGAGQMNEEAGDILDQLDRDDEAAARYFVAAQRFAAAGLPFEELRNRRQHAVSLTWAQGPEAGLKALAVAASLLTSLPNDGDGDDTAVRWERARQDFDEARIRARAQQFGLAAELAARAADTWLALGDIRGANETRAVMARLLLDNGEAREAEEAIRAALASSPDPGRKETYVVVLDATLRAQGRTAEADACWAEHGLSLPD